jgi:RNA polymerase sigma-70 factor (sigma-E family)
MGDWFPSYEAFAYARGASLVRLARALIWDEEEAQDVAQEVLAKVYVHWARVARADSPDAYITRMVVNECNSWRRRRVRREALVDPAEMLETGQPDFTPRLATREDLLQRIRNLPLQQRTVVALRYYSDLADDEIAPIMGCSVATVRSHASHALAALRRGLDWRGVPEA